MCFLMAKLHWLDSLKTDPHPLLIFANTVICTSCICYCITKIKPFQFRKTDHFLLFVDTPIFCLLICTCLTFHLLSSFTLLDTHSSSILSTPANLKRLPLLVCLTYVEHLQFKPSPFNFQSKILKRGNQKRLIASGIQRSCLGNYVPC